jgi:hypothetical protein
VDANAAASLEAKGVAHCPELYLSILTGRLGRESCPERRCGFVWLTRAPSSCDADHSAPRKFTIN